MGIDEVTKEYHDKISLSVTYKDSIICHNHSLVNYRLPSDPTFLVKIYRFSPSLEGYVCDLPKNFW